MTDQLYLKPNLSDLVGTLERAVVEVSLEEIPALLGDLERFKVMLWARITALPSNHHQGRTANESEVDQLLTPEEAARMLGVTPRWMYRHAKRLPFTKRMSRKTLRFSKAGSQRWLAMKKT